MAEALVRARSGGLVLAYSAGSHPKPLHPNAVRVMREEHGIDLAGQRSRHLSAFAEQRFDRVISLCDRVREICPEFPGEPETIHWSLADPAAGHADGDDEAGYPTFRRTAEELDTRMRNSAAAAFADVTRGNPRLLLSGPTSSAGRPMPDGTKPGPGGWNRIHLIVSDLCTEVARLRKAGVSFRRVVAIALGRDLREPP